MKVRADAAIAAGDPDHYYVREYQARIAPKGKKKSQQTCGYCGEVGHTRRTCDKLRKDREWLVIHHNAHVRVAHDYIVSSHVGLGSLFQMTQQTYNYSTGDYDKKNQLLVLTGFSINKDGKCDGFPIIATLRQLGSEGIEHSINIRHYVKDATYGGGWRSSPILITPMREVIPSDWVQKQAINFADTATLEYFHRSGRKSEDARDWMFRNIDRAHEIIEKYTPFPDDQYNHVGRAKDDLARYTPEHNRAKLFEDFKSGE
jgi:hypothetical protein